MKKKGYLLAAVSAFSYGLIPLFILPVKAAKFSLDTTLFYRFFISSLFILAYLLYKKEGLGMRMKEWFIMIILGLLYALSSEFLFLGYDYLTPGIASTLLFVDPVIVALIMIVFFKERMNLLTVVSLAITMLGVVALSIQGTTFNINFTGLFITLMSAVCYALYMVIINTSRMPLSGVKITFYSLFFSSMYYLGKTIFIGETLAIPDIKLLFDFTLFAFITTVLSISSLIYAIKLIGSTPTSIMGALEPVIAVGISVMLFHEELTLSLLTGVILIIVGVIINILAENKKAKAAG